MQQIVTVAFHKNVSVVPFFIAKIKYFPVVSRRLRDLQKEDTNTLVQF